MQDQTDQSQSQFLVPTPAVASSAPVAENVPFSGDPQALPPSQPAHTDLDPLGQASEAVEACVARTVSNPNMRMQEISKIRAAYIKAKFGMDITQ